MDHQKVRHRKKIFIWAGIGLLLLVGLCALVSILLFPRNEPIEATGPYAVTSVLFTLSDEHRIEHYSGSGAARRVNVEFWYPDDVEGIFPLVVFSHGGLGLRTSNLSLYRELASHGYVVGAIDHSYQALWTRDVDGQLTLLNLGYLADLQREDAQGDKPQSLAYYQDWMQTRMGDIHLVIDTVVQRHAEARSSVFSQIDPHRIGVMGHSLGGSAALGMGRQRDEVQAVIALEAPFLYEIIGVENDVFVFVDAVYPKPVMSIYSDDSWENLSQWPQYARNFELLETPTPAVFNVHISGVGHLALTDLALSNPLLVRILDRTPPSRDHAEVLQIINQLSLSFFDHFLKGEEEYSGFNVDNHLMEP